MLDDLTQVVREIGDRLEVVMVPKVEGPWDIHYVDRLLAQLEAKAGPERPLLVHAILETAQGVTNLEEIATASPRMQGMSFGPADLAANWRMKTTRVGGGHPGYRVIADPPPDDDAAPRAEAQQDPGTTRSRAWSTPARGGHPPPLRPVRRHPRRAGLRDPVPRSLPARLRRRLVAPPRSDRHRKEGLLARSRRGQVREEGDRGDPDGRGVHMIDGKMQDDATWKQCRVMVDLAEMLARKDPELAEAYEPQPA